MPQVNGYWHKSIQKWLTIALVGVTMMLKHRRNVPVRVDRCPSCGGALEIRALGCSACALELRGSFEAPAAGPLGHLSPDQAAFLRLFVTSRGNLSDVERTLGVSYPTVRAKLDNLIEALAGQPAAASGPPPVQPAVPPGPASRREVLEQISAGRLTAQEGLALLRHLSDRGRT